MTVTTLAEVEALRALLAATIWPCGGYPTERQPNAVEAFSTSFWGATANEPVVPLAGIDRLPVSQYLGVSVAPLHFRPAVSRGKALIFAAGHDGGPWTNQARNVVYRFVRQGFDVVTVAMPLYFLEPRPLIGNVQLGLEHGDLAQFQDARGWHPLAWFLEPTVAVLNYLEAFYGYTDVSMTGYSGGGWCTYWMAALDTRITRSYPVTAGLPLDIRVGTENGDWEQYQADVFTVAPTWRQPNTIGAAMGPLASDTERVVGRCQWPAGVDYRDLYVMAADRAGRSQLQMVNQLDPVFPDLGRGAAYGPPITAKAAALGGTWGYWIDTISSTEHRISDPAIDRMLSDLGVVLW